MMDAVLRALEETFGKSALDDLRSYVSLHPQCRKWLVYSDYCVHDKSKPNDVISFVVVPHDSTLEEQKKVLDVVAPVDWKQTAFVSPGLLAYLRSPRLFYVSVILEDTRALTRSQGKEPREVVALQIAAAVHMIESWIEAGDCNEEYCSDVLRRLKNLAQKMDRPSANLTLYRDILLISALAGFICFELTVVSQATITGWFSDRDKMIEAYDRVAFDLALLKHHSLCEKHGIDGVQTKMVAGVPKVDEGGKPWYDELNRLPDHMAGALADWDLSENLVSREKTSELLSKAVADNPRFVLLRLNSDRRGFWWNRIAVSSEPQ